MILVWTLEDTISRFCMGDVKSHYMNITKVLNTGHPGELTLVKTGLKMVK